MKEVLKRLWRGVNGISAADFSELHDRTQEKPVKDVDVKRSDPVHKSESISDGSEFKS